MQKSACEKFKSRGTVDVVSGRSTLLVRRVDHVIGKEWQRPSVLRWIATQAGPLVRHVPGGTKLLNTGENKKVQTSRNHPKVREYFTEASCSIDAMLPTVQRPRTRAGRPGGRLPALPPFKPLILLRLEPYVRDKAKTSKSESEFAASSNLTSTEGTFVVLAVALRYWRSVDAAEFHRLKLANHLMSTKVAPA
jgi:hypothetical protein